MLLILEEENPTNTLQLLYPPPNPTIFPIKII